MLHERNFIVDIHVQKFHLKDKHPKNKSLTFAIADFYSRSCMGSIFIICPIVIILYPILQGFMSAF